MIGKDEFNEKMGVMFREVFDFFVILPRFMDVQLPPMFNLSLKVSAGTWTEKFVAFSLEK